MQILRPPKFGANPLLLSSPMFRVFLRIRAVGVGGKNEKQLKCLKKSLHINILP